MQSGRIEKVLFQSALAPAIYIFGSIASNQINPERENSNSQNNLKDKSKK